MNLMHADDAMLLASIERDLERLVEKFPEMCERRCLQVNVGNRNMMEVEKEVGFTSHLQVVDKNHQVVK